MTPLVAGTAPLVRSALRSGPTPTKVAGASLPATAGESARNNPRSPRSGIIASITASVAFAALFGVPGFLTGLDPFAIVAWRVIAALPFLALILTVFRAWPAVRALLGRVRRRPVLVAVLVADAALFGLQIFLFGWGPATGNALAVSMGYFLLPLVVVAVGVVVLRERLSRMRGIAVALAALGVVIALVAGASISWATFAVAFGYPIYFLLRRRFQLDSLAGLAAEMVLLAPIALVLLLRPSAVAGLTANPANYIGVLALGFLTAAGFSAYTLAQRKLPMNLFGLLGYLEPVLLVVVSIVLLREPLGWSDGLSYLAIGAAIVVLSLDGLLRRRPASSRRR